MEAIETLINLMPHWAIALTALVTGANGISMFLPTESDNKIYNWFLKILNVVSGNILTNKNKDAR